MNTGWIVTAYRISSDWSYFTQECDRLETVSLKLKYPRHLFHLAIKQFVDSKVADQQNIPSTDTTTHPIRVIMPFKDQLLANVVKKCLTDLRVASEDYLERAVLTLLWKPFDLWFLLSEFKTDPGRSKQPTSSQVILSSFRYWQTAWAVGLLNSWVTW